MALFLFSNFTALAVTLKQAQTKEFKDYQLQVLSNAKVMANELIDLGYTLATGKNYIIIVLQILLHSFYHSNLGQNANKLLE